MYYLFNNLLIIAESLNCNTIGILCHVYRFVSWGTLWFPTHASEHTGSPKNTHPQVKIQTCRSTAVLIICWFEFRLSPWYSDPKDEPLWNTGSVFRTPVWWSAGDDCRVVSVASIYKHNQSLNNYVTAWFVNPEWKGTIYGVYPLDYISHASCFIGVSDIIQEKIQLHAVMALNMQVFLIWLNIATHVHVCRKFSFLNILCRFSLTVTNGDLHVTGLHNPHGQLGRLIAWSSSKLCQVLAMTAVSNSGLRTPTCSPGILQ